MAYQKYIYTLIYFYSWSLFDVISAEQECDKSKCKGPIKYYEDLQCTPIYSKEDSCCAIRYNCDHFLGRSKDKCYYKGHEYAVGEQLREEDRKPCDIGCTCSPGYLDNAAHFSCAIVDCFARPEPGCYLKDAHDQCCSGPQICPYKELNLTTCIVDGKTYRDGEGFRPESDPTLYCYCAEGYQGINEAPFCKADEPFTCGSELRHANEIYKRCSPGFYSNQNPATDCHFSSRCQNDKDVVLDAQGETRSAATPISDPSLSCTFGNLTLNIGDQLNQGTYYDSVCLVCVCEVPPIPTCQRLPDNECDVTVHAKFDDFSK